MAFPLHFTGRVDYSSLPLMHTLFKCIITSDYLNNANCHPQQGETLSRGIAEGQHVNDNNSLLSYQAGL